MWDWIVIKDALRAIVEIFILWVFLYQIYRAFHATRGARIMVGLFACFLALVVLAFFFQLNVISWILTRIFAPGLALALVVIFQPELRVGLAKLGSHPFFSSFAKLQRVDFLDNFCKAVSKLSNQRFGALFAFERSISMKPIEDSGVKLDAIFSPELALTIFHTKTALHDGGVVISGDRISAAACVFPVSQKEMSDRMQASRRYFIILIATKLVSIIVFIRVAALVIRSGILSFTTKGIILPVIQHPVEKENRDMRQLHFIGLTLGVCSRYIFRIIQRFLPGSIK